MQKNFTAKIASDLTRGGGAKVFANKKGKRSLLVFLLVVCVE